MSRMVAQAVNRLSRCFTKQEAAFSVPLLLMNASFRGAI